MDTSSTFYNMNFPKVYIKRIKKKEKGKFTQVFNHIIDAKKAEKLKLPKLKPTAGRLIENIISQKDGWNFSVKDMAGRVNVGIDAINTARKELVNTGYLKIVRFIDQFSGKNLGHFYYVSECAEYLEDNKELKDKIYHIEKMNAQTFTRLKSLPCCENPDMAEPSVDKRGTNNTVFNNNNLTNTSSKKGINEFNQNHKKEIEENIKKFQEQTLTPDETFNDDFLEMDNKEKEISEELIYKSLTIDSDEHKEYLESELHKELVRKYYFSQEPEAIEYMKWISDYLEFLKNRTELLNENSSEANNSAVVDKVQEVKMVNGLLTEREILDQADSWGFTGMEKYLKSKDLELITSGYQWVKSYPGIAKNPGSLWRRFLDADGKGKVYEIKQNTDSGSNNNFIDYEKINRNKQLLNYFGFENCTDYESAKNEIGNLVNKMVQKLKNNPNEEEKNTIESFIYHAKQIKNFNNIMGLFSGQAKEILKGI